ncbi:hypothetical protein SCHPADRAFT_904750 [Schizopora paradoxa]|uniref:Uncharacterized protein n=1 Tax=Schizopora paradoxa TaxID=27342 RepID=A0A0H2RLP4_9AGAM|nr:hypothetical protein SCHPADRAFT_904750 [Schizopora paradoxa]
MGGKRSTVVCTRVRVCICAHSTNTIKTCKILSSMHSSTSMQRLVHRYGTYRPSWKSKFKNPLPMLVPKTLNASRYHVALLCAPSRFSEDRVYRQRNSIMGARRRVRARDTIHDPRSTHDIDGGPSLASPIKICRNLEESRNEYTLDVRTGTQISRSCEDRHILRLTFGCDALWPLLP